MQSRKLDENLLFKLLDYSTKNLEFSIDNMQCCTYLHNLSDVFRLFLPDLGHSDCKVLQHCQDPALSEPTSQKEKVEATEELNNSLKIF